MEKHVPDEFTVTGLMPVIGRGLEEEAAKAAARQYVSRLAVGQEFWLVPEPDNPFDPQAVGVWEPMMARQVGYISASQTQYQVAMPFDGLKASALVTRWDDNRTFFVRVPGTQAVVDLPDEPARQLPRLPFAMPRPMLEEDRRLMVLQSSLLTLRADAEHVGQAADCAELCMQTMHASLCRPFDEALADMEGYLTQLLASCREWKADAAVVQRIEHVLEQIVAVKSNFRTCSTNLEEGGGHLHVLTTQLERLRQAVYAPNGALDKYKALCLSDPATRDATMQQHRRQLAEWFATEAVSLPPRYEMLTLEHAQRLAYQRLSREELYDLLYAWLLTEWLEAEAAGGKSAAAATWEECIPDYLRSGKLLTIWNKLRTEGFLTEDYHLAPGVNKSVAKYIARQFNEKHFQIAHIKNHDMEWEPFERYWGFAELRKGGEIIAEKKQRKIIEIFMYA